MSANSFFLSGWLDLTLLGVGRCRGLDFFPDLPYPAPCPGPGLFPFLRTSGLAHLTASPLR